MNVAGLSTSLIGKVPEVEIASAVLASTRLATAGVSTAVGGHAKPGQSGQFEISDPRSVSEMTAMLRSRGYQPVFKDWEPMEGCA